MSDIEKIKLLRQSTGAGFKDCNSAIDEAGGDLDATLLYAGDFDLWRRFAHHENYICLNYIC